MGEHTFAFHPAPGSDSQQNRHKQLYSPRSNLPTSPIALNPAHILRNGQDFMLPTTSAPEYSFVHPSGRQQTQCQDLTPCSAVSSFNMPAQYDSSLITPVSMTGSPCLPTRAESIVSCEKDIKQEQLSPSAYSPFQLFSDDDDFPSRYNQPMKAKRSSVGIQLSNPEGGLTSSYTAPEPYYGSYGVSTTPSSRALDTPPSLNYSPSVTSAGGQSTSGYHSQHHTPPLSASSSHGYRTSDQTPILIEPKPSDLRAMSKQRKKSRQSSVPSRSSGSTVSSVRMKTSSFERYGSASPPRVRKRKSKAESVALEDLTIPEDLPHEDRLLLELRMEGLEWKEIAKKYAEALQQPQLATACLQMRKKRLVDRILANAQNANHNSWDPLSKASFQEHVPQYSEAPRQTSSPRNWAESRPSLNTYHTSPAYTNDLERLTPLERSSRTDWSELSNPFRMQASHSTVNMSDIRARSILEPTSNFYAQRQENAQSYDYGSQQGNSSEGQEQVEHLRNW